MFNDKVSRRIIFTIFIPYLFYYWFPKLRIKQRHSQHVNLCYKTYPSKNILWKINKLRIYFCIVVRTIHHIRFHLLPVYCPFFHKSSRGLLCLLTAFCLHYPPVVRISKWPSRSLCTLYLFPFSSRWWQLCRRLCMPTSFFYASLIFCSRKNLLYCTHRVSRIRLVWFK